MDEAVTELFDAVADDAAAMTHAIFKRVLTVKPMPAPPMESADEQRKEFMRSLFAEPEQEKKPRSLVWAHNAWRDEVDTNTVFEHGMDLVLKDGSVVSVEGHLAHEVNMQGSQDVIAASISGHQHNERCAYCGVDGISDDDGYCRQHKHSIPSEVFRRWFFSSEIHAERTMPKIKAARGCVNLSTVTNILDHVEVLVTKDYNGNPRSRVWLEWDIWVSACRDCKMKRLSPMYRGADPGAQIEGALETDEKVASEGGYEWADDDAPEWVEEESFEA